MIEIRGKHNTAKVFTDNVESEAIAQIMELCNQEFVAGSAIRIMPDTHAGAGCTIGTTMTITDKVVPNLVGVDIGCFTGDTKVSTLDGKSYSLKELVNMGEFYVWACNPAKKVVAAKATAHLTRRNATLLRVILDNDEEIRCTPDHKFMLRDGTFIEAREMAPGTSLMPYYSHVNKEGYLVIRQPYSGMPQRYACHRVLHASVSGDIDGSSIRVGGRKTSRHRNGRALSKPVVGISLCGYC